MSPPAAPPSSIQRQTLLSVFLLLGIVSSLVLIAAIGFETLSSARAYVGGEALWSKAQKDAVYYLLRYAESHDSAEYSAYERLLLVPAGDRMARLELEKPDPDPEVVRQAFLQGRNNSEDLAGMARFYRRFSRVGYVAQAVGVWREGDSAMAELHDLGSALRGEIESPRPDTARIRVTRRQIYDVNLKLTRLEDAFSNAMGLGARWARQVLVLLTTGVAALLVLVAMIGLRFQATKLQAAEELRRTSEEQLSALVSRAQFGIIRSSIDGGVLSANPALVAILGYDSEEEVRSLNLARDVYANPADRGRLMQAVADEGVSGAEVEWKRKDGGAVLVRLHGRMVDDGGTVEAFVEDVTQQRLIEAQLRQAQKMEAVGQLTGGLAHDFNNLLSVILSTANLIGQDLPPSAAQARTDLAELETAARRGGAMIRKLLAFSRAEQLQFRPYLVAPLVEANAMVLRRLLPTSITIVVETDPETPTVNTDPAALEQILLNLATNARDAMPDGGTLRITTSVTPSVDGRSRLVLITVSDTGTGMSDAVRERYFEPFFTTKPVGEGSGLGTAMIYGLVKQHGGRIEVESAPGRGTTVRISLPAVDGLVPSETVEETREPTVAGEGTVLLAEDEPQLRSSARRILERFGYRVLPAADGTEALAHYARWKDQIDLIITDVVMPGMGGAALLAELQRIGSRTPVLITSGYTAGDPSGGVRLPEGVPFLPKPWDAAELLASVRDAIERGPS